MINIKIADSANNYKIIDVEVEDGTTIEMLLNNILNLTNRNTIIGVYGKLKKSSYALKDNDRIELYENIISDPKIKRKNKAKL